MKKILVFPSGSEIGLEIYHALQFSTHFELLGCSSVDDHGIFTYKNHIAGFPFYTDGNFISELKKIVSEYKIDAVFPTTDAVAELIKHNEKEIGCVVVGSSSETTSICASKIKTYQILSNYVPCPKINFSIDEINAFPVFIKPDRGHSSKYTFLAKDPISARNFLGIFKDRADFIFCEYLPGNEFTIDCLSTKDGRLLFHGSRKRARISNGISVNTYQTKDHLKTFEEYAHLGE